MEALTIGFTLPFPLGTFARSWAENLPFRWDLSQSCNSLLLLSGWGQASVARHYHLHSYDRVKRDVNYFLMPIFNNCRTTKDRARRPLVFQGKWEDRQALSGARLCLSSSGMYLYLFSLNSKGPDETCNEGISRQQQIIPGLPSDPASKVHFSLAFQWANSSPVPGAPPRLLLLLPLP